MTQLLSGKFAVILRGLPFCPVFVSTTTLAPESKVFDGVRHSTATVRALHLGPFAIGFATTAKKAVK